MHILILQEDIQVHTLLMKREPPPTMTLNIIAIFAIARTPNRETCCVIKNTNVAVLRRDSTVHIVHTEPNSVLISISICSLNIRLD